MLSMRPRLDGGQAAFQLHGLDSTAAQVEQASHSMAFCRRELAACGVLDDRALGIQLVLQTVDRRQA